MNRNFTVQDFNQLLPLLRRDLIKGRSNSIIAEWPLSSNSGVLLFGDDERAFIAPYVHAPYVQGGSVRRATPGDGVSIQFVEAVVRGILPKNFHGDFRIDERFTKEDGIAVDQTNESICLNGLDGKVILKWQIQAEKSVGAKCEDLLAEANFEFMPQLLGHFYFGESLIASLNEFIPDSVDGWTWCVEKAKCGDVGLWVEVLSKLTFQMHDALRGKESSKDDESMESLIHGDFHVGQILSTPNSDQLWVIDFDGDPLLDYETRSQMQSPLKDVASMACSFYHAGAVAIKQGANKDSVLSWIRETEERFIDLYLLHADTWKLPDRNELRTMMYQHEVRELAYSEKYLPRWSYVPEFAIEYMKALDNERS